jgi:hypothetical protein
MNVELSQYGYSGCPGIDRSSSGAPGNGLALCGTAKSVEKESSGSPFNDNRNSPALLCRGLAVQVGQ